MANLLSSYVSGNRALTGPTGAAQYRPIRARRSTVLASRIEWGSHAGRELAARLGALTGGGAEAAVFNPDVYHGTMYVGQGLLQAVAVAEAFGVTMKHLALVCLAAAAVTLLARDIKGKGAAMGH